MDYRTTKTSSAFIQGQKREKEQMDNNTEIIEIIASLFRKDYQRASETGGQIVGTKV